MVQQVAAPTTLQTLGGLMMVKVCTAEDACVLSQVMLDASIYDDGSWFVAYWDPNDLTRRSQAGGREPCEADALRHMFAAIASLAPAQP